MQTSRKRTNNLNNTRILVSILGFLCCCLLLSGCSRTADHPELQMEQTPSPQISEQQRTHVRECNGRKVSSTETMELVILDQNEPRTVAEIQPSVTLQLKETEITDSLYLPVDRFEVEGQQVYVAVNETVTASDSWLYPHNHLLPMDFSVTLKSGTVLEDDKGQSILTLNRDLPVDVYARKENRIGIEFQGNILWAPVDQAVNVKEQPEITGAQEIPVLMYHFFYDESQGETRKSTNFVEVNEFREQLQYLQDEGYTALTMQEVEMMMNGWASVPERSVVITIDDGDPTVYQYAYPVLQEFGMNAVLFLISGWMDPMLPYQFIEMRENGLELQSHSFLMHQGGCKAGHGGRILCVDHDEGVQDTIRSLDYVDGGTVYCYPFGDVNDHAVKILQDAGVHMAFTTEYGKIRPGMDLYRLPRIRVSGGAGLNRFIHGLQ